MVTRDTVHIWRIGPEVFEGLDAQRLPARIEVWLALLSTEERRRADAFHRAEHRRDYIVAHAALRHLLGRCLGMPPKLVMIGGEGGTKPALLGPALLREPGSGADVRFSLSHTRGAVLIGVALGRELGIDVEGHRPMDELEGMAQAVMSGDELAQWKTLPEVDQLVAFYHLWTRKEAYLKAIGLGLFRELQGVTIPVSAGLLAEDGFEVVQDSNGSGSWGLRDVEVWEGYSASVCWEGADAVGLVVRDLDLGKIVGG